MNVYIIVPGTPSFEGEDLFNSNILHTTLQLALHVGLCICFLYEILNTDKNI